MLDIQKLHAPILSELESAALDVLRSGEYINGPAVPLFEETFAQYTGAAEAIAVSSGTDALLVTLMALDVRPGDNVITTAYSFFATAGAIRRLGAIPIFVDIDKETFNIDETQIEAAINSRTVGILPVHLFGNPAPMASICKIAKKHGLWVVEDAAQALGKTTTETLDPETEKSMVNARIYSFFPAKNLGGAGDGGAVVTQNTLLANRIRQLRAHGAKPKYIHHLVGGNFRMDTLQAALLQIKIAHLDKWNQARRLAAQRYDTLLHPLAPVIAPQHSQGHVFNQYVIQIADKAPTTDTNDKISVRDQAMSHLQAVGIGCAIYYPLPLPLQPCFAELGHDDGHFLHSKTAAKTSLAIPINPTITAEEQQHVVSTLQQFFQER